MPRKKTMPCRFSIRLSSCRERPPSAGDAKQQEDAHPLIGVNDACVIRIEVDVAFAKRLLSVREPLVPLWVPSRLEYLLIDAVHQGFLRGEVSVQKPLRNPQPLRQFARLAGKADLREETHGTLYDLTFAFMRIQSNTPAGACGRGFSFLCENWVRN